MPPLRVLRLLKNVTRESHYSYFLQPNVLVNFTARVRSTPPIPGGLGLQTLTLTGNDAGGNREAGLDFNPSPQNGTVTDPFLLSNPLLQGGVSGLTRSKWPPQLHSNPGAAHRFNAPLGTQGAHLLALAARVVLTRPASFITLGPTAGYPVALTYPTTSPPPTQPPPTTPPPPPTQPPPAAATTTTAFDIAGRDQSWTDYYTIGRLQTLLGATIDPTEHRRYPVFRVPTANLAAARWPRRPYTRAVVVDVIAPPASKWTLYLPL